MKFKATSSLLPIRKHALGCAGVDDQGPLGPRPTHDEIVEEIQKKPATAAGREHAAAIAAANPSKTLKAKPKTKGKGEVKITDGEKNDGEKEGGKQKGKGKKNPDNINASHQSYNNNTFPAIASTGAEVHWRNNSASRNVRTASVYRGSIQECNIDKGESIYRDDRHRKEYSPGHKRYRQDRTSRNGEVSWAGGGRQGQNRPRRANSGQRRDPSAHSYFTPTGKLVFMCSLC
ncbi:hypothetical protein ElyMa_004058600 [Elysia marginata]|uniref:Btz domain-containing protein n=1 Tax=Elysia marginata TaxID=1093978 RepID=A0AAV4G7M1_9GAST|nr:hypothetical protein ElyMa_004058600 [Elysia marginata]